MERGSINERRLYIATFVLMGILLASIMTLPAGRMVVAAESRTPGNVGYSSDITRSGPDTTAEDLALAMGISPFDLVSASLGDSDPNGATVICEPVASFASDGCFAVLSSGNADNSTDQNLESDFSWILSSGEDTLDEFDRTVLTLVLNVPDTVSISQIEEGQLALSFNYKFYSEEWYEFVNTQYNDEFEANLDGTNYAYDSLGNLININSAGALGMTGNDPLGGCELDEDILVDPCLDLARVAGTTYDGATPLLTLVAPVTTSDITKTVDGQTTVTLELEIYDRGDHVWDSTVFIDGFDWINADIEGGVAVASELVCSITEVDEDEDSQADSVDVDAELTDSDGNPIEGATVSFHSPLGTTSTETDVDGFASESYSIDDLGQGFHNFVVAFLGGTVNEVEYNFAECEVSYFNAPTEGEYEMHLDLVTYYGHPATLDSTGDIEVNQESTEDGIVFNNFYSGTGTLVVHGDNGDFTLTATNIEGNVIINPGTGTELVTGELFLEVESSSVDEFESYAHFVAFLDDEDIDHVIGQYFEQSGFPFHEMLDACELSDPECNSDDIALKLLEYYSVGESFTEDTEGESYMLGAKTPIQTQIETVLTLNPISNVKWGKDVTVTGTLETIDGEGIGGATISFLQFEGSGAGGLSDVVTESDGTFTAIGASPSSVGTFGVEVEFDGDSTYLPSGDGLTYKTLKHSTTLTLIVSTTVSTAVVAEPGQSYKVVATLKDKDMGNAPIASKTITFTADSPIVLGSKVTNAAGKATHNNLVAPLEPGIYEIQAHFAADSLYLAKNSVVKTLEVVGGD